MQKNFTKRSPELQLALIALFSLSWVVYLGKAYDTTLRGIDSNIHARVALNVTSSGVIPQLPIPDTNTLPSEKIEPGSTAFNDHPFSLFWLNGWVMRLFGPSAWSARILTAAFSVGTVLLTFALGSILISELFGFISAIIFLFTRDMILTGATFSLDPPLLFFILLSFLLWKKKNLPAMSIATGVGLWVKTPVVLLIYPVALIMNLSQGKLKKEWKPLALALAGTLVIGSLVWWMNTGIAGWEWTLDYWNRQVLGTAAGGRGDSTWKDRFAFFRMIQHGFVPFMPLLILGIGRIAHGLTRKGKLLKQPENRETIGLAIAAIAVVGATITVMRFHLDHYFNPIFPFLCLIAALSIYDFCERYSQKIYFGFCAFSLVLMSYVVATPTSFGPEPFEALRKFMPYIQTFGKCDDVIYLVPGGEPIGSALDYQLVLNFYVHRKVAIGSCSELREAIQNQKTPSWVIVSENQLPECFQKGTFSYFLKVGHQYLFSQRIPAQMGADFTPLKLEMKAATQCKTE